MTWRRGGRGAMLATVAASAVGTTGGRKTRAERNADPGWSDHLECGRVPYTDYWDLFGRPEVG